MHTHHSLALYALLALATSAAAQWPTTSTPSLPIGDFANEQTLTKIAATSDGGCYLGWFDSRSGGYAVYLQRLDAAGVEQWPHGGILVSNNPQSTSLVDWDLLCDSDDHCVLSFTDTRAGGDLDIYAYRITPAGAQLWGANGVAVSNNSDYEPNPRICESDAGDFVVTWANTATRMVMHQRLGRASGTPAFAGDGIAYAGDTGASPGFVRIAAGVGGSVILSWVRTTAFSGNKHIHAQQFDLTGAPQWGGGTRLPVFDSNSVPIAFEPRLLPDGSGGALLGWHFAVGSLFSARVQHVSAAGVELFPHNGVDVSTSTNSKFDPALVWQSGTAELFVVWNERNVAQTSWGLFAQKFDAAGVRQWGVGGVTLLPINTTVKFAPVAAPYGSSGVATSVLVENLGLQQKSVQVFALDGTGAQAWAGPTLACTFASDKLRLAHATTKSGASLLAWTDQRSGAADVYAAAVDATGAIGLGLASATPYGCGGNPAGSLGTTGRPAIGSTMAFHLTNPLATQPAGSFGFFVLGLGQLAFPCGVSVPGFGMASPGAAGEFLVDIGGTYALLGGAPWFGGASTVDYAFATPFATNLLGLPLFLQGLMVDFAPGAPIPFGLSTATRLVLGS